jgi:hypothetical protein
MCHPPPNKKQGPDWRSGPEKVVGKSNNYSITPRGPETQELSRRPSPDDHIAIIDKNASTQIRVVISAWRGQHKPEIREFSPGPVNGTWWPNSKGVSLDINDLPQLLQALRKAEAEAVSRGLIKVRP